MESEWMEQFMKSSAAVSMIYLFTAAASSVEAFANRTYERTQIKYSVIERDSQIIKDRV